MKRVLVAIPTTGKRKDIFDVMKYASNSLNEDGFKWIIPPVFDWWNYPFKYVNF